MHTSNASEVASVAQKIISGDKEFIKLIKDEQERLIKEYEQNKHN